VPRALGLIVVQAGVPLAFARVVIR
jgi:hypothetical protein